MADITQSGQTSGSPSEATGVSKGGPSKWSFEEAFNDAISQIPSDGPDHPDEMHSWVVVSIGARVGGFPGYNELYVTVRGG